MKYQVHAEIFSWAGWGSVFPTETQAVVTPYKYVNNNSGRRSPVRHYNFKHQELLM